MIEDHLYLANPHEIGYVNVRGVFEDPQDVSNFNECEAGGCYDDSKTDFPISMDMLSLINQGILAGELRLLSGSFSDTENDRMQDPKTLGGGPAPQQK